MGWNRCRNLCDARWPKYIRAEQFIAGWKWCVACQRGIAPGHAEAKYCPCCGTIMRSKPHATNRHNYNVLLAAAKREAAGAQA